MPEFEAKWKSTNSLLKELEEKTDGKWTVDQIIAIAQIHATLAVAAVIRESRERELA